MRFFIQISKPVFIAIVVLFISSMSSAQTYTTGKEAAKADVNFTELVNYYKTHPRPLKRKPVFDEAGEEETEEMRDDRPDPDPSLVHLIQRNVYRTTASTLPQSPWPADTFLASTSDGTTIPPDTHGDISPTYCVTALNDSIVIRKRNGAFVSGVTLDGFWATFYNDTPNSFDPRIHFDPYYQRWILITDEFGQTNFSQFGVAVSATSDPTGTWHLYKFMPDSTGESWMDFPCVGFNQKWITVTGNYFRNVTGTGVQGAVVYVLNYASMMAGTAATYTKILQSGSFTIAPALTYDVTEPNMFGMEIYKNSTGTLRLWKISGPVASPTMALVGYPTTTTRWKNGGSSDFVPQVGTTDLLQAGDDRITRLVYRNHDLWCAHTVFLPNTGTVTRCSVMWWQSDTTGVALQNGLIDDPTTPGFYSYPSIAVNANNDALIGFAYGNSSIHPCAAYALHMHTDAADSIRPFHIFRHGVSTYFEDFSGTQNRWGDFSATCVDPVNDNDFWTIGESVSKPVSGEDLWDTWWAYVPLCPSYAVFSAGQNIVPLNTNDTITFTGNGPTGTTYSWNFGTGATPATSTSAGPITVKWSSYGKKGITLTVTSSTGCTSTFIDSILVRNLAEVNTITEQNGTVRIVPNPNAGSFDILFNKQMTGAAKVKLLNMEGRIVYTNQFDVTGKDRISIETKNLPEGNYIADIDIDGVVTSEKVTISR